MPLMEGEESSSPSNHLASNLTPTLSFEGLQMLQVGSRPVINSVSKHRKQRNDVPLLWTCCKLRKWRNMLHMSLMKLCLQLQELMLQMAAQAAASERKPSCSVANSTSSLWPPYAAPDEAQPDQATACTDTAPLSAPSASLLPFQPRSTAEEAMRRDCSTSQPGVQLADIGARDSESEASQASAGGRSTDAVHSSAQQTGNSGDAAQNCSTDAQSGSWQHDSDTHTTSAESRNLQKPVLQLRHHDASQPWATQNQPPRNGLPAALTERQSSPSQMLLQQSGQKQPHLGQLGLGKVPSGHQQHRRATVTDVPMEGSKQQQGCARQSGALHAARSLSWSHQAVESPQLHLHSSGVSELPASNLLDVFHSQGSLQQRAETALLVGALHVLWQ